MSTANSLPTTSAMFCATLRRELRIGSRTRGELANPLIFFLAVVVFVPLGISPDAKVLATLAPGMIWIIALLATLLSLDRMFQSDFEDGCLEQVVVSGQSLYWWVMAKVFAHWLMTGLPLTLLSPVLAVMMALPAAGFSALIMSLLLGTLTLSLVGAIGAALTVALRRGGLLISLIIMPLYVPVLIFGAAAVKRAVLGDPVMGAISMLGGFLFLAWVLTPLAAAGALRISVRG